MLPFLQYTFSVVLIKIFIHIIFDHLSDVIYFQGYKYFLLNLFKTLIN